MPDLDVVVPSAASVEDVLRRTLPSLRDALEAADLVVGEVIIVDDVAPRPALAALTEELGFAYREGPGRGPGPARDLGAAEGSAPLVCFVDDDVVLDRQAFAGLHERFATQDVVAVVGGLRPPPSSPTWLEETYRWATLTPASALAPEGPLPFVALATGFVVLRRAAWAAAGGFPDVPGMEDTLFGLRVQSAMPDGVVQRCHTLSGVHLYLPTWDDWLRRSWQSGRRLREVLPTLDQASRSALLAGRELDRGPRAWLKRALSLLPATVLRRLARTPFQRRLASAGAGARGYLGRSWR